MPNGHLFIWEDDFIWIEMEYSADPEACLHGACGKGLLAVFETLILPDMHPKFHSDFLLCESELNPTFFQYLRLLIFQNDTLLRMSYVCSKRVINQAGILKSVIQKAYAASWPGGYKALLVFKKKVPQPLYDVIWHSRIKCNYTQPYVRVLQR